MHLSKTTLSILLLLLSVVFFRILPHPANMAPIGALALFGGAYLSKRTAFVLPLVIMFVSDIFLGFHETMLFVYMSFLISGGIGYLIREHTKPGVLLLASLVSSTFFFLITNIGVWLMTPVSVYTKDITGLTSCLIAGIPFFRNTIIGDLFFLTMFCTGYALIQMHAGVIYGNLHKKR